MDVGNMKYSCRDEVYIDTRDLYTQTWVGYLKQISTFKSVDRLSRK